MSERIISIVTVSYNAVDSIESTILSVINQSYKDFEYIVVDGGSTDGTTSIIENYSSYISFFVSEPDAGIYDAMNKAIDVANGEWILFLNSGDRFVDNDVLTRVFPYMCADSKCSVIFGDTIFKYSWGNFRLEGRSISSEDMFLPFCHQSSFTKTALMKRYKFDLSYKIVADYGFFYKLYTQGERFLHVSELISEYEMGGFSSQREVDLYKEIAKINGTYKTRTYYKKITVLRISNLAKKVFPSSWTQKIRERRRLAEIVNHKTI